MTKLNFNQLAALQGGEDEAYCATLQFILTNNCITGGAAQGAHYGHGQGGCSFNFWSALSAGCGGG